LVTTVVTGKKYPSLRNIDDTVVGIQYFWCSNWWVNNPEKLSSLSLSSLGFSSVTLLCLVLPSIFPPSIAPNVPFHNLPLLSIAQSQESSFCSPKSFWLYSFLLSAQNVVYFWFF
jgi:hypothetical protein